MRLGNSVSPSLVLASFGPMRTRLVASQTLTAELYACLVACQPPQDELLPQLYCLIMPRCNVLPADRPAHHSGGFVHIVIMGCGRVGSTLARALEARSHSVSVIDLETGAFRRLAEQEMTGQGKNRQARTDTKS